MDGPLDGVRVIEVANWLAAPAAATLLADMGADVVKVEASNGDPFRGFRLAAYAGYSFEFAGNFAFELDNRGKRGITLNLEHAAAREALTRLLTRADVLITNLTPSRLRRYGLAYTDLAGAYPRLVCAYLTGYGLDGPERDRLGFDYAAFWARSGIMGALAEDGHTSPFQRGGMGDHATSAVITSGILAALYERERRHRSSWAPVEFLDADRLKRETAARASHDGTRGWGARLRVQVLAIASVSRSPS